MKTNIFFVSLAFLVSLATASCSTHRILTPEENHIPGYYVYEHSWDYPSPLKDGNLHCDETGILIFNADGTYYDTAYQIHKWVSTDSVVKSSFDYHYCCKGRWRVENGKFIFNEMSEGFVMDLVQELPVDNEWYEKMSVKIVERSTPNSDRWFTFDIERLDRKWFIWSYTYPNGRIDTWDMKRSRKN